MTALSALHDATLVNIDIKWAERVTTLIFRVGTDKVIRLTAGKTTSFHVPHVEPWGPSVSVNNLRQLRSGDQLSLLEIEMQSGDIIRIEAGDFAWS